MKKLIFIFVVPIDGDDLMEYEVKVFGFVLMAPFYMSRGTFYEHVADEKSHIVFASLSEKFPDFYGQSLGMTLKRKFWSLEEPQGKNGW